MGRFMAIGTPWFEDEALDEQRPTSRAPDEPTQYVDVYRYVTI
jgi:hypothetical protein